MEQPSGPMASVMMFLHRFGEVMGNIILGLLYFVLVGPVAVVTRLATDPLRTKRPQGSAFLPWEKENESVEAASRQG